MQSSETALIESLKFFFTTQAIYRAFKMETSAKPFRNSPMTNGYNGTPNAMSSMGSHNRSHTLKRQWRVTIGRERASRIRLSWPSSAAD